MFYVFLFTFSLLPLIFTLVAASISHVLTAAIKFSRYSLSLKDWVAMRFTAKTRRY